MKPKILLRFLLAVPIATVSLSTATAANAQYIQVRTDPATVGGNYQATLNGYLANPGGYGGATVWFLWGTSANYGNQTTPVTQNYTGNFSFTLYSLSPNTTYHYMAVARNNYGTFYGQDVTFYTSGSGGGNYYYSVHANAGPALYLASGQSATLQGSGYDNSGNALNYYWNCTGGSLSNSRVAQPTYTAPYVAGQTSYVCTLTATNYYGASASAKTTIYVTGGGNYGYSYVRTNPATDIGYDHATFNGSIYNSYYGSYYDPAKVWFQWGTNTNYTSFTTPTTLYFPQGFKATQYGLSPGTTYYYRAVIQNSAGTFYGQSTSFTTSQYPTYSQPYYQPYYYQYNYPYYSPRYYNNPAPPTYRNYPNYRYPANSRNLRDNHNPPYRYRSR